ncbi:type IX secretion system plug protein domain-containing protein [Puia sp. P3]|uniref:type IX secretion system plug protein n=1 Tax=Puia sp. P3 TaxID=3423952 RepID=UPI003D66C2D6
MIRTPQLFTAGNQLGYPVLRLGTSDQLELHFDDIDGNVKSYYYTIVLCNEDWTPAPVSDFDFIKGFNSIRIDNYQLSSVALTRYTHYQALLPDRNCIPIHSGNYLLKVYLDADTSKLAFTRRFLVTDAKATIQAQVLAPIDYRAGAYAPAPGLPGEYKRDQSEQSAGPDKGGRSSEQSLGQPSPGLKPTFYAGNNLEYNNDNDLVFEGGMEWRWLDLQSFRYQSDRIQSVNYSKTSTDVTARPDGERSRLDYYLYKDLNGYFIIQTTESINPLWQTDYASVLFSYVPPGNSPYPNKDVYVLGKFNGGLLNDSSLMTFVPERGRYERRFFMKQGYYSYCYATVGKGDPDMRPSFALTEGNHVETENDYTILVYYRALGARADELVGISRFNSLNSR